MAETKLEAAIIKCVDEIRNYAPLREEWLRGVITRHVVPASQQELAAAASQALQDAAIHFEIHFIGSASIGQIVNRLRSLASSAANSPEPRT